MFVHRTKLRLHDTDAAGVIFYGNQFRLVEEAFEEMLEQGGVAFGLLFRERTYGLPVVKAEGSYLAPLCVGDHLAIEVTVKRLGTTSFTLHATLKKEDGQICGHAEITHVVVDRHTHQKCDIPSELRVIFEKML